MLQLQHQVPVIKAQMGKVSNKMGHSRGGKASLQTLGAKLGFNTTLIGAIQGQGREGEIQVIQASSHTLTRILIEE